MAIVAIPIASGTPNQRQRTSLDGRDYLLTVVHNQRLGRWFLDLADQDEAPIAQGLRLVTGYPLLRTVTDPRRPSGELFVTDLQGSDELSAEALQQQSRDAGLGELGVRFQFVYFDAAEVAS